ncbi:MAG: adenylate cyclase regulatory domain-containing protein [Solirubrobacteraceae bacterium]
MDFEQAGLLDGLEGADRDAREQLLQQLADDGVGLDELKAAVNEDRLALLPVERVLVGRYTASEVEERSGLPADMVRRVRGLLGLPIPGEEDRVFSDADVEGALSLRGFLDAGFGEEQIAEITRVLGESMARLAATTTAAFVDTFLEPGDSEQDVAQRFAGLAQELAPKLAPVLEGAFSAHLREAVRRGIIGRAEREAGQVSGAQEMAVCFADLVGFTRLGGEMEPRELGTVAVKLGELAIQVAKPPVRLVKTIGDAAMFVSPQPDALVDVALTLLESAEQAELPTLRAGIAVGPALARAGDFYGHSVNVASRVTGAARPGSVLCTKDVRDAARDDFEWSAAGRHKLKGLSSPVPLYRARRVDQGSDGDGATGPKASRRRKRASS